MVNLHAKVWLHRQMNRNIKRYTLFLGYLSQNTSRTFQHKKPRMTVEQLPPGVISGALSVGDHKEEHRFPVQYIVS